jgi:cell division protein FtsA
MARSATPAVIPIAGDQVTNDIAMALRTPTQHAEEIKIKYACALKQLARADEHRSAEVGDRAAARPVPAGRWPRWWSRATTSCLKSPWAKLQRSGFENMVAGGCGADRGQFPRWKGVVELAEEVFHMPVRLGLPQHRDAAYRMSCAIRSIPPAVGLLLFGNENRPGQSGPVARGGSQRMGPGCELVAGEFLTDV